tara:strand:- start:225 stop:626 length:402 start_codon:yes stop_codon:yes gene_type:complete
MKTILLILPLLFAISCSEDDIQESNELNASWNLVKYEPGHFAEIYDYTDEIKWTFNTDNTVDVVIEDGTNVSDYLPLNLSGNYSFSSANELITLPNIDGDESYFYEIQNNELILSTLAGVNGDGIKITFNENE